MSWVGKKLKQIEHGISKVIPHQHARDRRQANRAAAEQISYYKEQKQVMHEEKARIDADKIAEKKMLAKKQVKSLRRAVRSPGFMEPASTGASEKLGD